MNRTRRGIWFVLNICFICMIFIMPASAKGKSAAKKNVPKKIVLNRTELLLYPGEERKLRVEYIKPEKASAKVVWKSKRKAVAAISPKGRKGNCKKEAEEKGEGMCFWREKTL